KREIADVGDRSIGDDGIEVAQSYSVFNDARIERSSRVIRLNECLVLVVHTRELRHNHILRAGGDRGHRSSTDVHSSDDSSCLPAGGKDGSILIHAIDVEAVRFMELGADSKQGVDML